MGLDAAQILNKFRRVFFQVEQSQPRNLKLKLLTLFSKTDALNFV